MELLPAERNVRIEQLRTPLTERQLAGHDGTVIFVERDRVTSVLPILPFGHLIRQLHRQAARQGSVSLLSARITPDAAPLAVAFIKGTESTFELLTIAARAWKELSAAMPEKVLFAAPHIEGPIAARLMEAMVAAALAGAAPLPAWKSSPRPSVPLRTINLVGGNNSFNASRALAVDAGNHLARWLTTLPPNVLNSAGYQRALRKLARTHRWGYSFLNQAALRRLGAGAFLAVARANAHAAAGIVRLRYRATRGRNRPRVTLVGKGICFDSGGINLKPHKSMYHMHEDMQGSAVAVGTLLALSRLKVPFDIDCWLAITENEIGAHAYRPQEIVRAANGTTIQVVHSDAEGRMVLADTLALAVRDKPDLIIDYATLTGACVTALTERYSGIFTNRPDWHAPLLNAGRDSGERVWPFPMEEDFDGDLDSSVADILQCTLESKGDHILAARFLNRFVPAQTPWIHIDLAASNRSGGLAHIPSDFTGFGVRYTTELLLNHSLPGMQSSATGKQPAGKLAKRRK